MQYRLNPLFSAALVACAAAVATTATTAAAASDGKKSDPWSNSGPDSDDPSAATPVPQEAPAPGTPAVTEEPIPTPTTPAGADAATVVTEEAPSPTNAPSETAAPSATETESETTAILAALPEDEATQKVIEAPVANARKALARATAMRNADDPEHARMMDAVAVEWARVAADLVKAREVETLLTKVQRELFDLKQKIDRARLLLEETHARRARATQQLDDLDPAKPASDKGAAQ